MNFTQTFFFFFQTRSLYIVQADLELVILLPQRLLSAGIIGVHHHTF
jgi:hypothetical protein